MTDPAPPAIDFLGLNLTPISVEGAADAIVARPVGAPFAYVSTANAQHVVIANERSVPVLDEVYRHAWLRTCDSRILRLLGKVLFGRDIPLAAGSDLTAFLLKKRIQKDDAISVIGGDDVLMRELRSQYGLTSIVQLQPPMGLMKNPEAIAACARFIAENPARYVFLACGYPQSEVIALRTFQDGKSVGTGLCIGGSLHFATGLIPRAPEIMQKLALEWLHRLWLNPRKHSRRVFRESLPVLWIALKVRLGLKSHKPLGAIEAGRQA